MNDRKFTFIDLFAGAGGLSEGFVQQGNFIPISHIEKDKDACCTLKTRTCFYYLKENDYSIYTRYQQGLITRDELYSSVPNRLLDTIISREISNESINEIFDKIDNVLKSQNITSIDLILGGPPCQAYSLVGRAVSQDNMKSDPRNYLYIQYLKFLRRYNPKMFVFENVPGLLTANNGDTFRQILNGFEELGYNVGWKKLNAADFGVLQNRKRIIIIGWKKKYDFEYPDFNKIEHDYVVRDLFSDLCPLTPGEENNQYINEGNEYLVFSGIRSENDTVLTQHMCRRHNANDLKIYKYAIESWNSNHSRIRYDELPDDLKTHKNQHTFLDRYKVVASDLPYTQTMIAHIAKDGHYFIHPDINQVRSISVREAARIQSFPDNFFFEGSRVAKFTQIGNAVPPLMANGIAVEINRMLMEITND